jgi:hypothetical protein
VFAEERCGGVPGAERRLVPPAGVSLFVRLDPDGQRAALRGEARLVYRGEIEV